MPDNDIQSPLKPILLAVFKQPELDVFGKGIDFSAFSEFLNSLSMRLHSLTLVPGRQRVIANAARIL